MQYRYFKIRERKRVLGKRVLTETQRQQKKNVSALYYMNNIEREREYQKMYMLRPGMRERMKERCTKYAKKRREALNVLKGYFGGCVDCGYTGHPAALDFDHKEEFKKHKNVTAMVNYPWVKLLEEIAKCELVCANCHRIRTANRHNHAI